MIKAVVFDFGNVISRPQDTGCYPRMAALCRSRGMEALDEAFFRTAFWKYRPDYDRGTLRGKEMYLRVLSDAGVTGSEAELGSLAELLLDEDLASWFHISEEVTAWALGLQRSGFALGILSNMPHEFLERYETSIELFTKADTAVFSCRVNQIKPEPCIYHTLIGAIGCRADEIVFFDDIAPNVEAARREGIRAFLWNGIEQGRSDWAEAARL